jgi:signal peptide peptidase SppA
MTVNANPWLARFAGSQPSLVAPEQQARFENCLHMLATTFDEPKARAAAAENDDFWPKNSDGFLASIRPYVVRGGVLMIPVRGVLLNDFPYQLFDYATGYEYIAKAFERGMDDANVKGIALVVDSPGGAVAGNFDLVDKMFTMRGAKPIRAYAVEAMYSAAYSVGSVADSITVSRTGGTGSIGVVTGHMDISAALKKQGVKYTFVFAGSHKIDGNPYQALPASVEARMQTRIDALYEEFVAIVARNRGLDPKAVRDTEAQTFTAQESVANGLADSIGVLDDALAAFAADLENPSEGDTEMTDKTAADTSAQAALQAARDEGLIAGRAEGVVTGRTEGAAAEKARIQAILASDAGKERPVAALAAALDTDLSVESASAFLAKLAAEAKPEAAKAATVDALTAAMAVTGGGAGITSEGNAGDEAKKDDGADVMALVKGISLPGFRR